MLFSSNRQLPQSLALTDLHQTRSWQQVQDQALHFSRYYRDTLGLQPDDHLALLIGNRVEFIEALLGAILAGLWITPINIKPKRRTRNLMCFASVTLGVSTPMVLCICRIANPI